MENKQEICNQLCATLKCTKQYSDLKELCYCKDSEIVTAIFEHGTTSINVAMDSGSAMIRDIMNNI